MASFGHLGWLHASADGAEVTLFDPGRTSRVVEELDNPQLQTPSIFFFIGRKAKKTALEELFPENNIAKGNQEGIATLRLDNSSRYSNNPIFFAESDPFSPKPLGSNVRSCHEGQFLRLTWSHSVPKTQLSNHFHARLFFLFTDVLCIFAEDFLCFENVVNRLKDWAVAGSGSNPGKLRPRVVIVKRGDECSQSPTYDLLQVEDTQQSLDLKVLRKFYSSVTVLHLAGERISPLARFRRLKELLWRNMDEMRQLRQKNRCLYSAVHFRGFFS